MGIGILKTGVTDTVALPTGSWIKRPLEVEPQK